jgi:hypothetical protein
MGILDEAIKEHLELKRQHGAGESELKQLEDEAFGAAERPGTGEAASDAVAEAPTQFMTQPDAPEAQSGEAAAGRRPAPHIADLQEAPGIEQAEPEPAQSEQAEPSSGYSTAERQAISEQPTEMYDVEEELSVSERRAPSEEELAEEELSGPRLAPVDPIAGMEEAGGSPEVAADVEAGEESDVDADADDEFWDEKRLSDELDQALEAPGESETEVEDAEPPAEETESGADTEPSWEGQPRNRDEDVLEETPDFLEKAPEDDQLWFEQKPPKDFDFDD